MQNNFLFANTFRTIPLVNFYETYNFLAVVNVNFYFVGKI